MMVQKRADTHRPPWCMSAWQASARPQQPTASTFTFSASVVAKTGGRAPPHLSERNRSFREARECASSLPDLYGLAVNSSHGQKAPVSLQQRWEAEIGIQDGYRNIYNKSLNLLYD
jgi:hypothetical protein